MAGVWVETGVMVDVTVPDLDVGTREWEVAARWAEEARTGAEAMAEERAGMDVDVGRADEAVEEAAVVATIVAAAAAAAVFLGVVAGKVPAGVRLE